MKNLKLSIFIIIIVGTTNADAQAFSKFGLEVRNGLQYFVKSFSQDRFLIKSTLGPIMTFHKGTSSGNAKVSIGQSELPFSTANYKLYVEDGIMSESLKIDRPQDWSDFVFDKSYSLRNLNEVEEFIAKNHHLPDVPSEAEIKAQGYYDQHEINKALLQKIEELTLYAIEQQKKLEQMEQLLKETKTK
jgi:hypothetical protein